MLRTKHLMNQLLLQKLKGMDGKESHHSDNCMIIIV
jgi:hypothetical protein